jgi:hypothetical protein
VSTLPRGRRAEGPEGPDRHVTGLEVQERAIRKWAKSEWHSLVQVFRVGIVWWRDPSLRCPAIEDVGEYGRVVVLA